MDAAYVEDKTFENVIYEEGEAYIQGEKVWRKPWKR